MENTTRKPKARRYAFRPTKVPSHIGPLDSEHALQEAARAAGSHFFEPDAMRFFGSRLNTIVWAAPNGSAAYFTTSERDRSAHPAWGGQRRHTVRLARYVRGKLQIKTASDFGEYATARAAENAARRLASGGA